MEIADNRCPWAIKVGITLHTRCGKKAGHRQVAHLGPGLEEWGDQEIRWMAGDSREYTTTRTDQWCWEEP